MQDYVTAPDKFKALSLEEQLMIVADLILYCAERKIETLVESGKSRVDSCPPAMLWQAKEKYWENMRQTLKITAELEFTRVRRGV